MKFLTDRAIAKAGRAYIENTTETGDESRVTASTEFEGRMDALIRRKRRQSRLADAFQKTAIAAVLVTTLAISVQLTGILEQLTPPEPAGVGAVDMPDEEGDPVEEPENIPEYSLTAGNLTANRFNSGPLPLPGDWSEEQFTKDMNNTLTIGENSLYYFPYREYTEFTASTAYYGDPLDDPLDALKQAQAILGEDVLVPTVFEFGDETWLNNIKVYTDDVKYPAIDMEYYTVSHGMYSWKETWHCIVKHIYIGDEQVSLNTRGEITKITVNGYAAVLEKHLGLHSIYWIHDGVLTVIFPTSTNTLDEVMMLAGSLEPLNAVQDLLPYRKLPLYSLTVGNLTVNRRETLPPIFLYLDDWVEAEAVGYFTIGGKSVDNYSVEIEFRTLEEVLEGFDVTLFAPTYLEKNEAIRHIVVHDTNGGIVVSTAYATGDVWPASVESETLRDVVVHDANGANVADSTYATDIWSASEESGTHTGVVIGQRYVGGEQVIFDILHAEWGDMSRVMVGKYEAIRIDSAGGNMTTLYWIQDGYLFGLVSLDISIDYMIKIAESMTPLP
jgi:hypothetical protein